MSVAKKPSRIPNAMIRRSSTTSYSSQMLAFTTFLLVGCHDRFRNVGFHSHLMIFLCWLSKLFSNTGFHSHWPLLVFATIIECWLSSILLTQPECLLPVTEKSSRIPNAMIPRSSTTSCSSYYLYCHYSYESVLFFIC